MRYQALFHDAPLAEPRATKREAADDAVLAGHAAWSSLPDEHGFGIAADHGLTIQRVDDDGSRTRLYEHLLRRGPEE